MFEEDGGALKVQLFLERDIPGKEKEGWKQMGKIFEGPGGWRQAWMKKEI
jgi:hypothetical protein